MNTEPTMIEYASGAKVWHINGKLHRADGPTVEHPDGVRMVYLNDKRHLLGGSEEWYLNDKRHRLDGPAVEWANGRKEWYYGGTRYKPGPAVEFLAYDPVSGPGLLFDGTEYLAGCARVATVKEALRVFKQVGPDYPSCDRMFLNAIEAHAAKQKEPN